MPYLQSTGWGITLFQSAPDREVGRCSALIGCRDDLRSFNPRPTVRSGDAGRGSGASHLTAVSIRARP